MLGFARNRPKGVKPVRKGLLRSSLEALETRQVLSTTFNSLLHPNLLVQQHRATDSPPLYRNHPIGNGLHTLASLDNDGKFLTGKDRQGNEWQITVHGPGSVIVTDATPNDGALDDDINTIQLVDTDPNKTYVTGQVIASARVITDGTVTFNRLISLDGVKSINLNGFTLARTLDTPLIDQPEIYLPAGVGKLEFHNIEAEIDFSTFDPPFTIQIGDPAHPLKTKPSIRIDSIFNTVFDSTLDGNPPGIPQTTPTVRILVNGEIHGLELVSSTQAVIEPAGFQFAFPQTSTTGRTAIRANAIDNVKAVGSLRNVTLSTSEVPFQNGLTGMRRLGNMTVGGVTDGLGIDVSRGKIGHLNFLRGLGDPTGAQASATPNATLYGTPEASYGYPAYGLLGGLVVSKELGSLQAGPANLIRQTVQDPDYAQAITNSTRYFTRAGRALTNAAVVTDGSIKGLAVVGDMQSSEVKAGANYTSYAAGLEPVRAPSQIGKIRLRGNLVNSVVSATYRPGPDGVYGTPDDIAGPGRMAGQQQQGANYATGSETALHNTGAGFYARTKVGYLPPFQKPKRIHGVNTAV